MYEVFVNNRPLVFTENQLIDNSFTVAYSKDINWQEIVNSLDKGVYEKVSIICSDILIAWKSFTIYFPKIVAGGGVVQNEINEKIYFLYF